MWAHSEVSDEEQVQKGVDSTEVQALKASVNLLQSTRRNQVSVYLPVMAQRYIHKHWSLCPITTLSVPEVLLFV